MEHSKMLTTSDTIDNVIEKIKLNNEHSYQWFAVKGLNGCLFALGGRKLGSEPIELKAYIPKYDENGIPIDYGNGYVHSDYGIDDWVLSYPTKNVKLPERFDLVAWLKEHDFRIYKPKLFSQTVAVKYETQHSLLI